MAGEEMIMKGKSGFASSSKNLEKVSINSSSLATFLMFETVGKRAEAQKAEADFFTLLKERGNIKPGAAWKDVSSLGLHPCMTVLSLSTVGQAWYFS